MRSSTLLALGALLATLPLASVVDAWGYDDGLVAALTYYGHGTRTEPDGDVGCADLRVVVSRPGYHGKLFTYPVAYSIEVASSGCGGVLPWSSSIEGPAFGHASKGFTVTEPSGESLTIGPASSATPFRWMQKGCGCGPGFTVFEGLLDFNGTV